MPAIVSLLKLSLPYYPRGSRLYVDILMKRQKKVLQTCICIDGKYFLYPGMYRYCMKYGILM